jgi:hypothetical protein
MDETKPKTTHTPEAVENKTLSSAGQSLLTFEKSRINEYKSFNLINSQKATPLVERHAENKLRSSQLPPFRYDDK